MGIFFSIRSANILKAKKKEEKKQKYLESELKKLENDLDNSYSLRKYDSLKNNLDIIYDRIPEGVRIRSKCDSYEQGKKSKKIFLNLENGIELFYEAIVQHSS